MTTTADQSYEVPLRPVDDRVLIIPDPEVEQVVGGLVVPFAETPNTGIVIAVGPGRPAENGAPRPLTLEPGDRVHFAAVGGTDVTVDRVSYVVIPEHLVLARIV